MPSTTPAPRATADAAVLRPSGWPPALGDHQARKLLVASGKRASGARRTAHGLAVLGFAVDDGAGAGGRPLRKRVQPVFLKK
jgi:hypothetical protein